MSNRILIVEDEPMVAIDIEAAVLDAGCAVAGIARNTAEALAIIDRAGCEAVILDGCLAGESAAPVAARLRSAGIPFIAVSGYTPDRLSGWLDDTKLIGKPFCIDQLIVAIRGLCLA